LDAHRFVRRLLRALRGLRVRCEQPVANDDQVSPLDGDADDRYAMSLVAPVILFFAFLLLFNRP
jgi:hypothetical protein